MRRQLLNKIFILLFFLPVQVWAQNPEPTESDITGVWKGELYNDTTQKYLPYEIAISEEKGKLTGYSYTVFDIDGKKELGVKKVKIKRKNDKLLIEDVVLIANNYSAPPPRGVRQISEVNLSVFDTIMQLSGNWSTSPTSEYRPLTGSVKLSRAKQFRPQELFKKLEELKLDQTLSFVKAEKKAEDLAKLQKTTPSVALADLPTSEPDAPTPAAVVVTPQVIVPVEEPIIILPAIAKPNQIAPATFARQKAIVKVAVKRPKTTPPITIPKIVVEEQPPIVIATTSTPKKQINAAPVAVKPVVKEQPKVTPPVAAVVKKDPPPVAKTEPVKKPVEIVKAPEVKKTVATPPPAVTKTAPVAVVQEAVKPPIAKTEVPAAPIKNVNTIVVPVPGAPVAAAEVSERKISNVQEVFFESDSLIFSLYDNGTIDGDTVSVLMNGNIIFSRQGLTTRANNKTVYITEDMPDSLVLVMYAENLGSIPPNTGLLVVRDGEATYDVRFRADLQSNAAIILRKKRKQ